MMTTPQRTMIIVASHRSWLNAWVKHLQQRDVAIVWWTWDQFICDASCQMMLNPSGHTLTRWQLPWDPEHSLLYTEPEGLWSAVGRHVDTDDHLYAYQAWLSWLIQLCQDVPMVNCYQPQHFSPGFEAHRVATSHLQQHGLVDKLGCAHLLPCAPSHSQVTPARTTWIVIDGEVLEPIGDDWQSVNLPLTWQSALKAIQHELSWNWMQWTWQSYHHGAQLVGIRPCLSDNLHEATAVWQTLDVYLGRHGIKPGYAVSQPEIIPRTPENLLSMSIPLTDRPQIAASHVDLSEH